MGVDGVGGPGNQTSSVPYTDTAVVEMQAEMISRNYPELRSLHFQWGPAIPFDFVLRRFVAQARLFSALTEIDDIDSRFAFFLARASYSEFGREWDGLARKAANPEERAMFERAAFQARFIAATLTRRREDESEIFTSIMRMLKNPERRQMGMALLGPAAGYAFEGRPAQAQTLKDVIAAAWEGFEEAAWQPTLASAMERMRGKYEFERNAELLFTTDVPWNSDAPILSPRQAAHSIWHEIHRLTLVERGIPTRSLFTLLLNGEKNLFDTFNDLTWRHRELGDAGRMQRHALNHLILVAAAQKLTDARRVLVDATARIIDSDEFRNEDGYMQTLRAVADNVIVFLSYPEVNPKLEQEVAALVVTLYGRRRARDRNFEIGNALALMRPFVYRDDRVDIASASSLEELSLAYHKLNSGGSQSTPPAPSNPIDEGGGTAPNQSQQRTSIRGAATSSRIVGYRQSSEVTASGSPSVAVSAAVAQAPQAGALIMAAPQMAPQTALLGAGAGMGAAGQSAATFRPAVVL
jgi:hypothetical protein